MALGSINLVISVYMVTKEEGNWPEEIPYEAVSALYDYSYLDPDTLSVEELFEGKLVLIKDQAKRFYYAIPNNDRPIIEMYFLNHLSKLDDNGWGVLNAAQQFLIEKGKEGFWDQATFDPSKEEEKVFQERLGSFAVSLPKNTI